MFRGLWRRATGVALLVVAVLMGTSARGADNSLQLVPADAGFYSAMLRNKEQVDLVVNSKAFQSVWALPQVQKGWTELLKEYNKDKGEMAQFRQVIESPLGKDLVGLLTEAVSDEVFTYGSDALGDTLRLALNVYNTVQYGPLMAMIEGKGGGLNQQELQGYYALKALSENLKSLKMPDVTIGFKLKNTERAEKFLKMLEDHGNEAMKKAPPQFKGRLKRTMVGKSNLLTVNLDGSLVPWAQVPIADLEQKAGEFADLTKTLKQMTLTVSLGIHEGFLILSIGPSTDPVSKLSTTGKLLKDSTEFKLLAKAGTNRITDISYTSKAYLAGMGDYNVKQFDQMIDLARKGMAVAPLPEAQKARMLKDVEDLLAAAKKMQPTYGAAFAFNFMTPRGTEGYTYDWTTYPTQAKARPLTLLNHAGGSPILAAAGVSGGSVEEYKTFAGFVKTLYGYGIDLAKTNIPDEDNQKRLAEATKAVEALAKKFDGITVDLFYPATSDGQLSMVMDAKWTSKEWVKGMATEKAMPMLELGLLMSLSDSDKFVQAMNDYRKLINEGISEFGRVVPEANVPPGLEIPLPQKKAAGNNTLYFYPLGEVGLDKQFQPMFGIAKNAVVLAFSEGHTTRLLTPTPLKVDGGPLMGKLDKPLLAASYVDLPALIDAMTPWAEMGILQAMKQENADKKTIDESMKAFQTVVKMVKCLKVSTTATYKEDGATVTHAETVVKDID